MKAIIVSFVLLIGLSSFASESTVHVKIDWGSKITSIETGYNQKREVLYFDGCFNDPKNNYLPVYQYVLHLNTNAQLDIVAENIQTKTASTLPQGFNASQVANGLNFTYTIGYMRKQAVAYIKFVPLLRNGLGQVQMVTGADLRINITPKATARAAQQTYASSSVLANGSWYKVGVPADGMYKMDYNYLKDLGIDVDNIDPRNIHVYGNGGGMLPEKNSVLRPDDLEEDPIIVSGEGDGHFNPGDFVLFYGQSPHAWTLDANGRYHCNWNLYSNQNYYFITVNGTPGARIGSLGQASGANNTVDAFDDHQYYHTDQYNLIKSGRTWYSDLFNFSAQSKVVTFNMPNLITSSRIYLGADVAARSTSSTSTFTFNIDGQQKLALTETTVTGGFEDTYAQIKSGFDTVFVNSGSININVAFNNPSSQAMGWLNYIELNGRRQLTSTGTQMSFRDRFSVGTGKVSQFNVQGMDASQHILEVTNPANPQMVSGNLSGSQFSFTLATSGLREFFLYQDNGSFPVPSVVGHIDNQNLHANGQTKMLIITPSSLASAANTLANYHRNTDGLTVSVVNVQQIYNEFSSGRQDLVAIRDFIRMLYTRAGSDTAQMPKYILLMGRGSYDYKDVVANNTNLIPVYESPNSNNPVASYCSDDYLALLDDNEGDDAGGTDHLDACIGRLPVTTIDQANNVINKIMHYKTANALGSWRNNITFIADDEDGNQHQDFANILADTIETNNPVYNVDKIYLDAYQQVSTPAGPRYPDVNAAINRKIFTGNLIMNYTGHGGVNGLALERVLTIDDIRSWTNFDQLPLFVTATCQLTQFDDPSFVSAGEEILLNPQGGGIALVSTVRLVLSYTNQATNKAFLNSAMNPIAGNRMPTLGESVLEAKTNANTGDNNRKYGLFGDPALTLDYPQYNVVTTGYNAHALSVTDTLKALAKVTFTGEVRDLSGNRMQNFNGTVYPTIFDKRINFKTLSNDGSGSPVEDFSLLKNIIFKGKASVNAGRFSFTFIVPKDIAYNYGFGKISYYSDNGTIDANGYDKVMIGGSDSNYVADNTGPDLNVFMNDEKFVFGGLTDPNPLLLVKLYDFSGINTVGNGIGHDLTGVLDDDTKNTLVLNDYYEADKDSFQSGKVRYPLTKLSEGRHSIKVKAWDVYNNSAEGYTEFVVASSADLALSHVLNYPNPFTTSTNFQFEHNKPGEMLFVQVKIYTVTGKLVKVIQEDVQSDGYRVDNIHWDGLDDYGDKIGRGVYVYKLNVTTPEGAVAHQFEKLVILR